MTEGTVSPETRITEDTVSESVSRLVFVATDYALSFARGVGSGVGSSWDVSRRSN